MPEKKKTVLLYLILSILFILSVNASEKVSKSPLETLHAEIDRTMKAAVCREGKVGIVVQDLQSGDFLFEHNPNLPLVPASNQKIVTTIAALEMLTPQYTFKTDVFYSGELKGNTLHGDLYISGGGDPFLVKEEMWKLAERVYSMGVHRVKGRIIADNSFFDGLGVPSPDWKRIKMPLWYNAPTGGLAFNFNAISVVAKPGPKQGSPVKITVDPPLECFEIQGNPTTGAAGSRISLILDIKEKDGKFILLLKGRMPKTCETQTYYRHVNDAVRYAGYAFKYYLEQNGIIIDGSVDFGPVPADAADLVTHESRPLYSLLQSANKFSNNFMIEQTVKTIAAEMVSQPGTTMKGLKAIHGFYTEEAGINTEGMVLNDGSGLSRKNRITARQFAQMIRYATNQSMIGPEFLTGLPIAGTDGTLKKRLKTHPEKLLIRAKTGLIDNVVCLSGVVDGRAGKGLAFSIMINRNKCRHRDSKKVQDKILKSMLKYWKARNSKNEPEPVDQHPHS